MLIKRLKVDYFGKFHNKEIELSPGINLLQGDNEAGKSTIHTFIRGMLFGIERLRGRGAGSKEDVYTRYLPWDYPGAYGGQMDILVEDKTYRLQRSFHANDKSFTIIDLETGREIKLKEGHISELIPGLMETTFRNTISIGQLRAETDAELATQVGNYITNLSIAKTREVNVEKAVTSLGDRRKALESLPYDSKLKKLQEEIEEGEEREREIDTLAIRLKALESKEKRLKEDRDAFMDSKDKRQEELMDELPAILERFRTYQGFTKQYKQLGNQIEELENKVKSLEKEYKAYEANNDAFEPRTVDKSLIASRNKSHLKGLLYVAIALVIALIAAYGTKNILVGVGVLLITLITRGIILYVTDKRNRTLALSNQAIERQRYIKSGVNLDNSREILADLRDRKKQLEDSLDEIHDTIMIYLHNFISEDQLTIEAMDRLKEAISNKRASIAKDKDELNIQIDHLGRDIDKIRWELSSLEDNETELIKNKDRYVDTKQKKDENDLELDAIKLALNTIRDLSSTIHDGFGKELNQVVSDLISEVTNDRYQDLKIDEKLNIKLGWKDKYIKLDNLSAGTIDQVYFSLRLAVTDLLLGEDNMPLILDDSFALYDDKRVKATLLKIAGRSQVIIFSCQMREKKFLEELGIPFNLIKI